MPIFAPPPNEEYKRLMDQAKADSQATGEPEGGGHVLDMVWKTLSPGTNKVWRKLVEGKYQGSDNPWSAAFGDVAGNNPWDNLPGMPAAGTIKMGGKVYPNAMLHRAESNPDAIDWWGNVFQRGKTTQKPTSLVSPNMLPTFGSEPYGLLFNVNNEKSIANRAFPEDVWSFQVIPENIRKTQDKLKRIMGLQEGKKEDSYIKALDSLEQRVFSGKGLREEWVPGTVPNRKQKLLEPSIEFTDVYPPGSVPDLHALTSMQKDIVEQKLKKHGPKSQWIDHAEIIPDIDPSMLAGVRIPMFNRGQSVASDELIHKLLNLAEDRKVPVYRWDADLTLGQQLKGLQDPFAGNWGTVPGTDYKTSSKLPHYWKDIRSVNDLPRHADPIDYGGGIESFGGWDY